MSLVPVPCPIGTTWRDWDLLTLSRHTATGVADHGRARGRRLAGLRHVADLTCAQLRADHMVAGRRHATHVHGDTEVDGLGVHVDWVWVRAWGPGRSLAEVRVFVDGTLAARAWRGGCSLGGGGTSFPAVAWVQPDLALVVTEPGAPGEAGQVEAWGRV